MFEFRSDTTDESDSVGAETVGGDFEEGEGRETKRGTPARIWRLCKRAPDDEGREGETLKCFSEDGSIGDEERGGAGKREALESWGHARRVEDRDQEVDVNRSEP